jgi:hypothetical protein
MGSLSGVQAANNQKIAPAAIASISLGISDIENWPAAPGFAFQASTKKPRLI